MTNSLSSKDQQDSALQADLTDQDMDFILHINKIKTWHSLLVRIESDDANKFEEVALHETIDFNNKDEDFSIQFQKMNVCHQVSKAKNLAKLHQDRIKIQNIEKVRQRYSVHAGDGGDYFRKYVLDKRMRFDSADPNAGGQ